MVHLTLTSSTDKKGGQLAALESEQRETYTGGTEKPPHTDM